MVVFVILSHTVMAWILAAERGERQFRRRRHGAESGFKRVRTVSGRVTASPEARKAGLMANGEDAGDFDDEDYPRTRIFNYAALGAFVFVVLVFNIWFWTAALGEYGKTPADVLMEKKPIR